MISTLRWFKRTSYPLNIIQLDQKKLKQNYHYLESLHQNLKIAPVLKSNAYGHGLKEIGKVIDRLNPPFICVDSLYEAFTLQKENLKSQILIMGYIDPKSLERKKLPFSYAVFNLNQLEVISKYQKGAKIHLFIETGLNREGIPLEGLDTFLKQLPKYNNLKIEGIMSHLAATSDSHQDLWENQIKNFKKALAIVQKNGIYPKWVHLGSSGAAINPKLRNKIAECSNVIRTGRAIYGIKSGDNSSEVLPVLSLKSKIYQIKNIQKGGLVGYEGTFVAKGDMIIGTLPLGYFDGVDRRLSNQAAVTINGVTCPIIGRVSMNITTIDISKVKNPTLGMEVLVISPNPADPNSIENFATIAQTIPHDLLVHLVGSTRREVI